MKGEVVMLRATAFVVELFTHIEPEIIHWY